LAWQDPDFVSLLKLEQTDGAHLVLVIVIVALRLARCWLFPRGRHSWWQGNRTARRAHRGSSRCSCRFGQRFGSREPLVRHVILNPRSALFCKCPCGSRNLWILAISRKDRSARWGRRRCWCEGWNRRTWWRFRIHRRVTRRSDHRSVGQRPRMAFHGLPPLMTSLLDHLDRLAILVHSRTLRVPVFQVIQRRARTRRFRVIRFDIILPPGIIRGVRRLVPRSCTLLSRSIEFDDRESVQDGLTDPGGGARWRRTIA